MFIISTTIRDGRNITQYASVADTGETRIDTIEWTGSRGSSILYRECDMEPASDGTATLSVVTDRDWQSPPLLIRLPVSGALFTLIISFSVDVGWCRFSFEPSMQVTSAVAVNAACTKPVDFMVGLIRGLTRSNDPVAFVGQLNDLLYDAPVMPAFQCEDHKSHDIVRSHRTCYVSDATPRIAQYDLTMAYPSAAIAFPGTPPAFRAMIGSLADVRRNSALMTTHVGLAIWITTNVVPCIKLDLVTLLGCMGHPAAPEEWKELYAVVRSWTSCVMQRFSQRLVSAGCVVLHQYTDSVMVVLPKGTVPLPATYVYDSAHTFKISMYSRVIITDATTYSAMDPTGKWVSKGSSDNLAVERAMADLDMLSPTAGGLGGSANSVAAIYSAYTVPFHTTNPNTVPSHLQDDSSLAIYGEPSADFRETCIFAQRGVAGTRFSDVFKVYYHSCICGCKLVK